MKMASEWDDIPVPLTSSSKWRANEVRKVFALLRDEYKNSKRLPIFRRYRELERIINMFTSDQILQKLSLLTRSKTEEENNCINKPRRKSGAGSAEKMMFMNKEAIPEDDDAVFEESSNDQPLEAPQTGILNKVVNRLSGRVRENLQLTILPHVETRDYSSPVSPMNDSYLDSPSDGPNLPNLSGRYTRRNCRSLSSVPSSPSEGLTPTSFLNPFTFPAIGTATSSSSSSSRLGARLGLVGGSNGYSNGNARYSKGREVEASSQPVTPKFNTRRRRMDQYIVRSDQIPAFQIPPQRKTGGQGKSSSKLYGSDSTQSSPLHVINVGSDLHMNLSFSNIDRFSGSGSGVGPQEGYEFRRQTMGVSPADSPQMRKAMSKNTKSEQQCFISHRVYQEQDFFSCEPQRRLPVCVSEFDEVNIYIAHEHMIKLKKDFENLRGKNILVRYKRMKSILKNCMRAQI